MSRQYWFMVGTQETGKTTNAKKFLKLRTRNLILPPNRDDETWDDIEEIDWRKLFRDSTKLDDCDALGVFTKASGRREKEKFRYALAMAMHTFSGNRTIFIDKDSRFIYECICHTEYGIKNAGVFHDDYRNYILSNNLPSYAINFVTNRRKAMNDLYYLLHSFENISREYMDMNPSVILHYVPGDLVKANMSDRLYRYMLEQKKEVDKLAMQGEVLRAKEGNTPRAMNLFCTHRVITSAMVSAANLGTLKK